MGQNATIDALGTPSGGTYFWPATGVFTSSITVSPPVTTTYDVEYTLLGCTIDTSAIVIIEAQPTLSVNSEVICSGDSVELIAIPSVTGGTFEWSTIPVQTTPSIWVSPVSNAVYTVTYTINGFTTTPSISTVTVNPTPQVDVNSETICDGQPSTLTATPTLNGGTYDWSPGGLTTQSITISPNTTTTYDVEYTLSGCIATGTGVVTVNPVPNVTIGDETICEGESVTLTATSDILGGDFLWSNNIAFPSITVSPSDSSVYSVFYTITGCSNTASANVNVNVIPTLIMVNDTICEGEVGTITSIPSPSGGTYLWEDNSVLNSFSGSPATTTDYEVVYTLNSCPSIPVYGTIEVNPIPVVSIDDTTICVGETAVLTANVSLFGGDYSWDLNGEITSSISVTPATTTSYNVDYVLAGCLASANANVIVQNPSQLAILVSDTSGCAPLTVSFTNPFATAGSICTWDIDNGDTFIGCDTSYTFENGGCYDVNLTVDDGVCISTTSEFDIICLDDQPMASFIVVPPLLTETSQWVQMNNNSSGAVSYSWDFGDGETSTLVNPQHMYMDIEEGYFISLIAYSIQGCPDTALLSIDYQEEPIIYIPNTFTPDGDEHNHIFLPVFTSGYDPYNFELMIFNRWGEVIFESHDAEMGWDGSYGGSRRVEDGVYTYKIVFKVKKTDERRLIVGHVTLIR